MKFIFTLLFVLLIFFSPLFSQITAPGDIAFVGSFNGTPNDVLSWVFLKECPDLTAIQFTDKEWDGSSFDQGGNPNNEGVVVWTNNTGGPIAPGTVIHITSPGNNPAASIGVASEDEGGFGLGSGPDQIYAVLGGTFVDGVGYTVQPTTFLAFVGDLSNTSLTNTGLQLGLTAIDLGVGDGHYIGSSVCNGTLTDCLQMLYNPANWTPGSGFSSPADIVPAMTGSALPIELTHFNGQVKKNQIELTWGTSFELQNDYMQVERSSDGRIFKAIEQVQGAGTTFEVQTYRFTDKNPLSGLNYYRLRQVEFDGNEQVFPTIVVTFKSGINDIHFFPTLVANNIILKLDKRIDSATQVDIFYLSGQKVMKQVLAAGDNAIEIDVSHLIKGSYFALLTIGSEVITKRFVKM